MSNLKLAIDIADTVSKEADLASSERMSATLAVRHPECDLSKDEIQEVIEDLIEHERAGRAD